MNYQHETYLQFHFSTITLMNKFFQHYGGERKQLEKDIGWNELSLSRHDPHTQECELEVQRIIHLQN